jgi:CubicO group peptidase (beta-lactamase class C family)
MSARMKAAIGAAFILLFASTASGRETGEVTTGIVVPESSWHRISEPERLGWSAAKLARAKNFSRSIGSAAVMIVDDGSVVAEWGLTAFPYKLHSIRKPLLSALIGRAQDAGTVDLDASMAELDIDDNPPSLSEVEKTATVAHLMQARSGIYHSALGESTGMKAARPQRHSHFPGTFWYYNNWDFNVLGTIYERLTGASVCESFDRQIAKPLRMEDFEASNCDYVSGSDSIHRQYRFRMSARDLARFGLLYMRGGNWRGTQIVPENWIAESTVARTSLDEGRGYGHLWVTIDDGTWFPNVTLKGHAFGHSGNGVHFLLVMPERRLVIVHRVDTDRRGPRPAGFMLGHLIWMILDAAGETGIGDDPSYAAAAGTKIKADNWADILGAGTVVLEGTRRSGLVEAGTMKYTAELAEDGVAQIKVGGRVVDSGNWWVDGAGLSFRLERMTRGQSETRFAVADGSRIRFYDPDSGSLAFTMTRVDD